MKHSADCHSVLRSVTVDHRHLATQSSFEAAVREAKWRTDLRGQLEISGPALSGRLRR
jgi:hypothetical protein